MNLYNLGEGKKGNLLHLFGKPSKGPAMTPIDLSEGCLKFLLTLVIFHRRYDKALSISGNFKWRIHINVEKFQDRFVNY